MEVGQTFESPSATTLACAVETCPTKQKKDRIENLDGGSSDGSCLTCCDDEKASHDRTSPRQVAARLGGKSKASSEADCREKGESDCASTSEEDMDDVEDSDWDPAENEDDDDTYKSKESAGKGKMARGGSDRGRSRVPF